MINIPNTYIASHTDEVIAEIKSKKTLLNDRIEPFPDLSSLEKFATYHYWSNSESVNVFQVIGSAHPDYIGVTWIDMLKAGKRMHLNLPLLASNPDYYYEQCKKEPVMHYTRIDDNIYISGEGNHRTAIAKVFFYFTGHQVLHGIEYNEYRIDHEMLNLYQEIRNNLLKKSLPVSVDPFREIIRRDDTAGWKKDYYNLYLLVKNHKTGKEMRLSKQDAVHFLNDVNHVGNINIIRKIFYKRKCQIL